MPVAAGAAQIDRAGRRGDACACAARMARAAPTISSTVGLRIGDAPPDRRRSAASLNLAAT